MADKAEEFVEVLGLSDQDIGYAAPGPGHSNKHTDLDTQHVPFRVWFWRITVYVGYINIILRASSVKFLLQQLWTCL